MENSNLLIAAIVAIVAVVGLVILFSGSQANAATVQKTSEFGFTKIMRPCEAKMVGSSCVTAYSQLGVCENLGQLRSGKELCHDEWKQYFSGWELYGSIYENNIWSMIPDVNQNTQSNYAIKIKSA